METLLTYIDRNETLRYLGCKPGVEDEALSALLDRCSAEIMEAAAPRFVYRAFDIEERDGAVGLCETRFSLLGEDIRAHLSGCTRGVLMAATLGAQVERVIRTAQVTDMTRALALDCCATAAIEQVCDAAQEQIRAESAPLHLTFRYSPGYGDMPISQQKDFTALLDTQRKIGLTATASNILTPRKSVTAVIGLSKTMPAPKQRGCAVCALRETCNFRKAGATCANT